MKPQKSEQQFKTKPAAATAQNAASTSGKMTVQGMCGGCALNAGVKVNDCCGLCQHVKRAEPDAMHKAGCVACKLQPHSYRHPRRVCDKFTAAANRGEREAWLAKQK